MPCTSEYPNELVGRMSREITEKTQWLCAALAIVERDPAMLDDLYKKHRELEKWWNHHKELDRLRRKRKKVERRDEKEVKKLLKKPVIELSKKDRRRVVEYLSGKKAA